MKANKQRQIQFNRLRMVSQSILDSQTPYRTGQLRGSIRNTGNRRSFTLSIGREDAPYVYWVNERWTHPRWRGRQNPREGFIHRAAALMAQNIEQTMNVKRGD